MLINDDPNSWPRPSREAFEQGKHARTHHGTGLHGNPHVGSWLESSWRMGWCDADANIKAREPMMTTPEDVTENNVTEIPPANPVAWLSMVGRQRLASGMTATVEPAKIADGDTPLYEGVAWQPIETAPDDGTPHLRALLVRSTPLGKLGKPIITYWEYHYGSIDDDGRWLAVGGDDYGWEADDFTYWMDVPEPADAKRLP